MLAFVPAFLTDNDRRGALTSRPHTGRLVKLLAAVDALSAVEIWRLIHG